MRKDEIDMAIKSCKNHYFKEDKKVMIDESVMRIKGGIFYIYDLIFFGNKIIISEDTLEKIKRSKNRITYKVFSDNCSYLLENVERNEYGDYEIVDIGKYGTSAITRLVNYLKKREDIIYLLTNRKLYDILLKEGLKDKLKLLDVNMKVTSLCKNNITKFTTLGFVKHKNGKMFFQKRPGETFIKVYSKLGEEKEFEDAIELEVNDIILTRSDRDIKYCFNIYQIVTKHSRNFAIRIIWTDILKGKKTNFYVRKLDYIYQKMIEDNS